MGLGDDAQGFARAMSVRANTVKVEWPTVAMVAGTYGLWFAAGIWLWPAYPVLALLAMGVLVSQHSSLVHECLHGHPTRNGTINELLVALPLGLIWPYRRYKKLHLLHHADERLTDPFDDPESYYMAVWKYEKLPAWFKAVLRVNNTLAGRFILNPLLGSFGLMAMDFKAALNGDRHVIDAWARHLAGANNNLHLAHHKQPTAPWYRLPLLFAERRDEWMALNKGYVFPNYLALVKQWAFKAKEPVAHPVLRRGPEA